VHGDKIVYPAACGDRACPFVHAYEDLVRRGVTEKADGFLARVQVGVWVWEQNNTCRREIIRVYNKCKRRDINSNKNEK